VCGGIGLSFLVDTCVGHIRHLWHVRTCRGRLGVYLAGGSATTLPARRLGRLLRLRFRRWLRQPASTQGEVEHLSGVDGIVYQIIYTIEAIYVHPKPLGDLGEGIAGLHYVERRGRFARYRPALRFYGRE
jgi:hypothetical protein